MLQEYLFFYFIFLGKTLEIFITAYSWNAQL